MAAASERARAGCLVLAAMLAIAPVAAAQQTVEQPAYSRPTESRIETAPLPPIGGDAAAAGGAGAGERLPQPRFLRVPTQEEAREAEEAAAQGAQPEASGGWQSSRDRRFHRAPQDEEEGPAVTAPAPIVPIDPPATDLRTGARLRELDKMTGQTKTFEIGVGEEREIDRLRIRLEACRSPEGNDMHGTMAFLKVWDSKYPDAAAAFSGWMFAESPALSALDHPRYDLWVISCTTSIAAASASSE